MAIRNDAAEFTVEMGGKTFKRGTWHSSTITINGIVTLDGEGDSASEFLFQSDRTLAADVGSKIVLIGGGAKAENVLWEIGTSIVFGSGIEFEGSILAGSSIVFGADITVHGCVVAKAAITFGAGNSVAP
jgi:hypothetical protein